MKHKRKLRITSYCLLGVFILWGINPDFKPRNNVANLVKQAEKNPQLPHYQSDAGSLRFVGNTGYVMVLSVGNQSGFEPNQYITISQLRNELAIEVIFGAGKTGVRQLPPGEVDDMLRRLNFPVENLSNLTQQRATNLSAALR